MKNSELDDLMTRLRGRLGPAQDPDLALLLAEMDVLRGKLAYTTETGWPTDDEITRTGRDKLINLVARGRAMAAGEHRDQHIASLRKIESENPDSTLGKAAQLTLQKLDP